MYFFCVVWAEDMLGVLGWCFTLPSCVFPIHAPPSPPGGASLLLDTVGRYLDLSKNAISGTIPKELSTLTLLRVLGLNNNKLTGNIPTQFTKLAVIEAFTVNNNALSKAIPTTLGAWGAAAAAAG